ncbi:DUF937 domain-containing protein [Nonomuraea sp. K274]|uniref:DUF937 domain-containing protein n=1 Tax=Nonomuraea cypriaca TaxID=1187855 RepID=A0A931AJN9_9ACTN|nr:DUF937 domain-containing protein [Nonomuraea cypriaca]MBF8192960.1 DUF937 domain-containing protein [Nonomuraea cypriaca]
MTLNDELLAQLGDSGLEQIAGMLGTDRDTARDVVQAVSGTIIGGMAANARHPDGAEALRSALDDHVDTDPFNGDVASLTRDGHSILGHVLGGQGTEQAAAGLSQLAGIGPGTIMKVLALIAPMIMSLLAERAQKQSMDAVAVADDLDREQSAMPGGLGDVLAALLGSIFGGVVPRQGGPYEPQGTTLPTERALPPERSLPTERSTDVGGS